METLWVLWLLLFLVVYVSMTQRQWRREMTACVPIKAPLYTAWCDDRGNLRFVQFSTDLLGSPVEQTVRSYFAPIHWFSLGCVAGAGIVFRLGQMLWPATNLDLPLWDLVWVGFVAIVWLAVFIAEHVRLRFALRESHASFTNWGDEIVAMTGAIHAVTSQHRLLLLALAAVGLPAQWHVTLVALVVVGAFWWLARATGSHASVLNVLPGELERPFSSLAEQIREGVWIAPTSFLLVIGAAALLYFNDVSSVAVAALSALGCGLVVTSERISRLYTHQKSLDHFREELCRRVQTLAQTRLTTASSLQ